MEENRDEKEDEKTEQLFSFAQETNWQQDLGIDEETVEMVMENLLFVSTKPLGLNSVSDVFEKKISSDTLYQIMKKIQRRYEEVNHLRIVEVAGGFQLRSKVAASSYIQKIKKTTVHKFPAGALEVLSMIAFQGPITRMEIEKIRGTDCSHYIRMLMEKKLIAIRGESHGPGNPSLYATTSDFLEFFSLNSLEDLPRKEELDSLLRSQEVGEIKDIRELRGLFSEEKDTLEELKELEEMDHQLNSISVHSGLTKHFEKYKGKDKEEIQKKSTFELLEDYMTIREIKQQNQMASESLVIDDFFHPQEKREEEKEEEREEESCFEGIFHSHDDEEEEEFFDDDEEISPSPQNTEELIEQLEEELLQEELEEPMSEEKKKELQKLFQ